MNKNHILSKALSAATHPASLAALILLLINDQFLRYAYPSWLTGKLSDFAWLLVFPFGIAAILSYIMPTRYRTETTIGKVSIILVGSIFLSGKTIPALNHWLMDSLSSVVGLRLNTLVDPSDLIALPILWLSWLIWKRSKPYLGSQETLRWGVLPFIALLTIGNTARMDFGVVCLLQTNDRVFTPLYTNTTDGYISRDGGLIWERGDFEGQSSCSDEEILYPQELVSSSGLRFRYSPGENIQTSTDGGLTWDTAIDVHPLSEAQQELYDKKGFIGMTRVGPITAVEDINTGNIIFAMGWEGVLVFTDNNWRWISVGDYERIDPSTANNLFTLLNLRLILAVTTALMVILVVSSYLNHGRWWHFFFILSWLTWGVGVVTAIWDGKTYLEVAPLLSVIIGGLFILIMSLQASFRLIREAPAAIGPTIFTALVAMILFAVPYLLWSLDILPQYIVAMIISVVLFLVVLIPSLGRFKKMVRASLHEEE